MSEFKKKVYVLHGDCDYLIFKRLKELKKSLQNEQISINEFFGTKSLTFKEILSALDASDLFLSTSAVIVRDIVDGKSFLPYVEKLTLYLNSAKNQQNILILVNFGKILKTSKLYKTIAKIGEVEEFNQPKDAEILNVIKKSIAIHNDAAHTLLEYSNRNLFIIRNEIKKLENYRITHNKTEIETKDIQEVCVRLFAQDTVWGIGNKFLLASLSPDDSKIQVALHNEIDISLKNNVPAMQILYSFYQYTLNAIKLKQMISAGKSFKECMAIGYFFVKEFFELRSKIDTEKLFKLNSTILDIEYQIKTGQIQETIGIKKLLLSLVPQ